MQHFINPYSREMPPFVWWDDAFSSEGLDWLQQKAKQASTPAQVGRGNGRVADDIRRSELSWLNKTEDTAWVYETLANVVASTNSDYFGFNLTGFGEALQLTNYHESRQGNYTWHQDFGSRSCSRKLSLVVQLSDPEDYDGGQLQILTGKDPINIPKKRGLIVLFPSWTVHQVTPVVKGNRQTLVTWISGPSFT